MVELDGGAEAGDGGGGGRDATTGADAGPPDDGSTAADADATTPVDAAPPCPGDAGPAMVDVGGYCIDSTEVTEAQYATFLAAVGSTPSDPAPCAFKTSHTPDNGSTCRWNPAMYPNLPVVCVDWCDATAYCKWAGKRLCGKIGGGSVAYPGAEDIDATKDQWYRACSMAGTRKYPYGNTLDAGACNGSERNVSATVAVGSRPGCVGGYPGLFDMVGNAFEWENSCADNSSGAKCKLRSGSWFFNDGAGYNRCSGVYTSDSVRSKRYDDTGFRCCAP